MPNFLLTLLGEAGEDDTIGDGKMEMKAKRRRVKIEMKEAKKDNNLRKQKLNPKIENKKI